MTSDQSTSRIYVSIADQRGRVRTICLKIMTWPRDISQWGLVRSDLHSNVSLDVKGTTCKWLDFCVI